MKHRLLAGVLVLTLLLGCLTACKQEPQKYAAYSFDYFDTATSITGYADSQEEFNQVSQAIEGQLKEYHQLYNIYL